MSRVHVDPLASTYAEVLGDVAWARGGAALAVEVGEALSALGHVWSAERLVRAFFLSALMKEETKREAMQRLLAILPPLLADFMRLLMRRGRGQITAQIADAYEVFLDVKLGRVPVTLNTATPVSAERIEAWADQIRAVTGKEPVFEHVIKPELVAGAVLRVGDAIVDGSARRRLSAFQERVRERGKHALQA